MERSGPPQPPDASRSPAPEAPEVAEDRLAEIDEANRDEAPKDEGTRKPRRKGREEGRPRPAVDPDAKDPNKPSAQPTPPPVTPPVPPVPPTNTPKPPKAPPRRSTPATPPPPPSGGSAPGSSSADRDKAERYFDTKVSLSDKELVTNAAGEDEVRDVDVSDTEMDLIVAREAMARARADVKRAKSKRAEDRAEHDLYAATMAYADALEALREYHVKALKDGGASKAVIDAFIQHFTIEARDTVIEQEAEEAKYVPLTAGERMLQFVAHPIDTLGSYVTTRKRKKGIYSPETEAKIARRSRRMGIAAVGLVIVGYGFRAVAQAKGIDLGGWEGDGGGAHMDLSDTPNVPDGSSGNTGAETYDGSEGAAKSGTPGGVDTDTGEAKSGTPGSGEGAEDSERKQGTPGGGAATEEKIGTPGSSETGFFTGAENSLEFSQAGLDDFNAWIDGYEVQNGDTISGLAEEYLRDRGNPDPSIFEIDAVKDAVLPDWQAKGFADEKGWIFTGDMLDTSPVGGEASVDTGGAAEVDQTPEVAVEQKDPITAEEVFSNEELDKLNNVPEGMGGRQYVQDVLGMDTGTWDAVQSGLHEKHPNWFYPMSDGNYGLIEGKMPPNVAADMYNALLEASVGNGTLKNGTIDISLIEKSFLHDIADIPAGTNVEEFMKQQGLGNVWREINRPEVAQQLVSIDKGVFSYENGELAINGHIPDRAWEIVAQHMNNVEKVKFGLPL